MLGKGYSIEYMEKFVEQTMDGITAQVEGAAVMAFWIGIGLIILIAALFLKLRMVSEANFFAVKKAIGIPYRQICLQELYPIMKAGAKGGVIGVILSVLFGDDAVSMMFRVLGLGIQKLQFIAFPIEICVMIPVVLLIVLTAITLVACRQIKGIDITAHLNGGD